MDVTPEIVRGLLHYDPITGIFTWLERDGGRFGSNRERKRWNSRYAGKRAGFLCTDRKTGYQNRQIGLLGRHHLEHRLAWLYMTGDPLPEQIDHRNQNATDNRWLNLRASTNAENHRNQSLRTSNTSGITGVIWDKTHRKWAARCTVSGRRHSLGNFDDIDEAANAVMKFRAEHGFDPRHGAELAHYHQECLS